MGGAAGIWGERVTTVFRFLAVSQTVSCVGWPPPTHTNPLLFADDVILMAPSVLDLQHSLNQSAPECEAAGMWISTSKSEAMVLNRKPLDCSLRVGNEPLPQVKV